MIFAYWNWMVDNTHNRFREGVEDKGAAYGVEQLTRWTESALLHDGFSLPYTFCNIKGPHYI